MSIIENSCTWRDVELDHLKVRVVKNVDVREMIPGEVLGFEHLVDYGECIIQLLVLMG